MQSLASSPKQRSAGTRVGPSSAASLLFIVAGLLETVLAYFAFSRADDHAYFLELATQGLAAVPDYSQELLDLKAKIAGQVFYSLTFPGRWLGGSELAHLLWLRLLTIAGFLAGFNWLHYILAPEADRRSYQKAYTTFICLVLMYPGQLAWTASLLRDGVATALFFFGLACLRKDLRILLAPMLFGAAFALRPEYALILASIFAALLGCKLLNSIRHRIFAFLLALLVFSIAAQPAQMQSATFAELAFGDGGMAYPLVASAFDFSGYLGVFLQGVLDPIPLAAPAFNAFGLADCLFFAYLLWQSRLALRNSSPRLAALTMALLFGLWVFAYFEIYVSGFSRHRLCLEVGLIALIAIQRQQYRRTPTPANT